MSFVSFQREGARANFFRSTILAGGKERERERERESKVGTVQEKGGRAIRKEKKEAGRAVCLNPVGFPSVRIPALFSRPCGGHLRRGRLRLLVVLNLASLLTSGE